MGYFLRLDCKKVPVHKVKHCWQNNMATLVFQKVCTLTRCMYSFRVLVHTSTILELNDAHQTFISNEKSKPPYTLVQCRIR